ncbi:MAG: hypothetical protein ACKVVT_13385 [Dehalococcoidia bacterium]
MDVACLLVPNFLVALARREEPRLDGLPVVVGGAPEDHAEVTACSDEAAAAGVVPGTTLRKALALCPKAVFLPLQESFAAQEASRIADLLRLYSPKVEVIAHGHAHFDIRGLAKMTGQDDDAYLRDLYDAVTSASGLPVRIAAAETVFAAHAGAVVAGQVRARRGQDGPLLIQPGETRTFLAQLPVEVLPVPPLMHQRLRLFGLERLGQVAALTFSAIQAQFGRDGARAWELARGKDGTTITPQRDEVTVVEELDLPAPAALSEPLIAGTRALLERALNRTEIKGQSVRRLDWRAGLESGESVQRRFVFREPTADPARMLFLVRGRVERLQLPAAAVSISVTLSGLCSEYGHQANLWPVGPRRWRELCESIDQLNTRTGGPQVFRIVEVQPWSRIPERQLGLVAFGH